ncbi:MAG: ABC transporter ATP-binding protein [Syntrophaceae bacterium]|nr:ABC transporter ATP-binding protein [Syntrophaceae bacterium]
MTSILEIRDLRIEFETFEGVARVLDGIDLVLGKRDTLGLVGETGCGKSITAKAILKLLPMPPARIVSGQILFEGMDLIRMPEEKMGSIRGEKISMVFQDPMTFLNPVFTIEEQLVDVLLAGGNGGTPGRKRNRKEARKKAIDLLREVKIPQPELRIKSYPHEFSGGMRQRVLIAMALSKSPKILIADEPTTALDVTIQAQILRLMDELVQEHGHSVLLISHDLGVVARVCQRIAVMYAGNIVEICSTAQLFKKPYHPYTQGLLNSILTFSKRRGKAEPIQGTIPDLIHPPPGCRFHPRCPSAMDRCRSEKPSSFMLEEGHWVSCLLFAS